MKENRRAVLCAEVRPLAVQLRRVMSLPEDVEQLFVTHFCRIERHLHHFRMPRFVRANIFVGRIRGLSAAVPCCRIYHSRHALKRSLHAPEAACSERRNLRHGYHPRFKLLSHPVYSTWMLEILPAIHREARAIFASPARPPRRPLASPAPALCRDCLRKRLV